MGCAYIHDFVSGTTIALATAKDDRRRRWQCVDIVRPNLGAEALVAHHLERLEAVMARPD